MKIKEFLPGLSIAILISLLAWFLGNLFPIIGGPVLGLFIGLLLGIILRDSQKLKTGMQFTSKKVLQYAVVQQKVELAIEKNVMSPILQSFVLYLWQTHRIVL
mgnify:CR=1 FL=1